MKHKRKYFNCGVSRNVIWKLCTAIILTVSVLLKISVTYKHTYFLKKYTLYSNIWSMYISVYVCMLYKLVHNYLY